MPHSIPEQLRFSPTAGFTIRANSMVASCLPISNHYCCVK